MIYQRSFIGLDMKGIARIGVGSLIIQCIIEYNLYNLLSIILWITLIFLLWLILLYLNLT